MRRASWIVLTLVLLSAAGCGQPGGDSLARAKRAGLLKVGTDATYPPFETVDASGQVAGFDADLLREIGKGLGFRVEFLVVPFDGILAALKSGKYDAVISALTITDERARQVLFSEPYYEAGQSICVRSDSPSYRLGDLVGRRIGVQLGTTGERLAQGVDHAEVVSFDAIGAAFLDLRIGRLDAVISDTPTAALFARAHPEVRLVGGPITRESYGIAFRLDDKALKNAVDEQLREMGRSGKLLELRSRWGLEAP
ncbi:MAG: basic amino acid ABC transporter substrate-binding protein [Candidatus Eisenbacteria bacterium]|nr:basic amino acid ABC transporter substrate-binding protein [Candidatus Eisenbacteria bacterium]